MKYIFLFIIAFILNGCSPKSLENSIENLFVASSGNKPPSNFKIANVETMRDYVFDMPDYTIALPSAKEEDFTLMNGWEGATFYNKNVVLHMSEFGILYHIYVSTSIDKYTEREKAIETNNVKYLRSKIKIDDTDKLYIKRFGKKQYLCTIMEYTDNQYPNNQYSGYNCYKPNIKRTMIKKIHIRLTYSKSPYSESPNFPKETSDLIKEYTYEDLQERAKRMLDSLYIKDGWDE
jgi:hypothetical protein